MEIPKCRDPLPPYHAVPTLHRVLPVLRVVPTQDIARSPQSSENLQHFPPIVGLKPLSKTSLVPIAAVSSGIRDATRTLKSSIVVIHLPLRASTEKPAPILHLEPLVMTSLPHTNPHQSLEAYEVKLG